MTESTIMIKHLLKATIEYIEKYQIDPESPWGRELMREIDQCEIALKPFKASQRQFNILHKVFAEHKPKDTYSQHFTNTRLKDKQPASEN